MNEIDLAQLRKELPLTLDPNAAGGFTHGSVVGGGGVVVRMQLRENFELSDISPKKIIVEDQSLGDEYFSKVTNQFREGYLALRTFELQNNICLHEELIQFVTDKLADHPRISNVLIKDASNSDPIRDLHDPDEPSDLAATPFRLLVYYDREHPLLERCLNYAVNIINACADFGASDFPADKQRYAVQIKYDITNGERDAFYLAIDSVDQKMVVSDQLRSKLEVPEISFTQATAFSELRYWINLFLDFDELQIALEAKEAATEETTN